MKKGEIGTSSKGYRNLGGRKDEHQNKDFEQRRI